MEKNTSIIECPNCGQAINVNEMLFQQIDDGLKKKYSEEMAKDKQKLAAQLESLEQEKEKIEREKKKFQLKIDEGIQAALKSEKQKLEKELRKTISDEQSEQILALQDELGQKSEQLKELHKTRAAVERLKREKEEIKSAVEAEAEKKLNARLKEERDRISRTEEEKNRFRLSEKEQIIAQLRNQLQEAQRKAEQGSMQLQGEVQELAIEEWLAACFPHDTIQEIKKGARGADCLQIINTNARHTCGSILYESKRTKGFQKNWIEKFKSDLRENGADIGVLVTQSMPAGMERMGLVDGIWVCSFEEFKGLCSVLRESVVKLSAALATQENRGDKMGLLYQYLTSNEFRLQIEGIVEGFVQMRYDLDAEKRSMQGIWKKREKQIEKVVVNTTAMYGAIKGIAGNAIKAVTLLELPAAAEEEE